ncbi:MAG: hypothetical protein NC097_08370 [Clostridium sp.]|nr:hypothetical protein [Clostridium sp.]
MIPKTIHFCWFGKKSKPLGFDRFLETWHKHLPDYKFVEWNEDNFDVNMCDYSREAYLTSNFAHVSDVCRAYALYTCGGIYLDTDVQVLKSFNPYLALDSFVSAEGELIGTAVIGASKGAEWLKKLIDYYHDTHFINMWGHTVRTPNTKIIARSILPTLPPGKWPTIFPEDFFSGVRNDAAEIIASLNSVAIHHFAGSWIRKKTAAQRVKAIINGLKIRY